MLNIISPSFISSRFLLAAFWNPAPSRPNLIPISLGVLGAVHHPDHGTPIE